MSNTIYQYVKILINRHNEKVENWRNICQWLEESGYKSQSIEKSNPPTSLDAKVNIENINIDSDKIEIGILIQLQITTK